MGYTGVVAPEVHRKHASHASNRSWWSSNDPFIDPIDQEIQAVVRLVEADSHRHSAIPLSTLQMSNLATTHVPHALSPLSEHPSSSSLVNQDSRSSLSQTQENTATFENVSRVTSATSQDLQLPHPPVSPRTKTIIGVGSPTTTTVRRSDSWWSRFTPTSILDRRSSDASRRSVRPLEIRDPNPLPTPHLGAIAETNTVDHSERPGDHSQPLSRGDSRKYGANNVSRTSLKTTNSEALEHLAGTMHVVQRLGSRSRHRTGSTGSLSIDTHTTTQSEGEDKLVELITFNSPVDMTEVDHAPGPSTPSAPMHPPPAALVSRRDRDPFPPVRQVEL